jgi:quercetin dioxygenase-like cupin family protein
MKPSFIVAALACVVASIAIAGEQTAGKNVSDFKFIPFDGLPTCTTGAVAQGDPAQGTSFIVARVKPGCEVPWHWHTPAEHLMIVDGEAEVQMKDQPALRLRAGGFAMMPGHHVHRFRCASRHTTCVLYVYADSPFDIHYVDAQGTEIPAAQALQLPKM